MYNRLRFQPLYLLVYCVQVLSNNSKDPSDGQCSLRCTTPELRQREIYSKCNYTQSAPLKLNCSSEEVSLQLENLSFLDLSNNKLKQVPSWMFPFCKNLKFLSLDQNSIRTIESGSFRELRNLKSLNLSFNDLREWTIDRNNQLQSLDYLDVTGSEDWLPSKQLLQLKNLTTVRGVTWTKYCNKCSLVKKQVNAVGHWLGAPSRWEWHDQIQYGKALDFIKVGFWPTCLYDRACLTHQYSIPFYQAAYDVSIHVKAFSFLYVTGFVALLVNITVVLVILCHKSFRGDLAVWLILNIAVCDVLISLFTVLYAKFDTSISYIDSLYDQLRGIHYDVDIIGIKLRNIMGPILTCAVTSQVFGSFILTLEKFLKIVFTMRPEIRIGKRSASVFLFFSWSLSATFAILPVFKVGRMTYNAFRDVTPLPVDKYILLDGRPQTLFGIAAGTQIVLIIIQLASFVLYLPIFLVAKKSGVNVGIKREATIARKIALLVFTNLIFFTVPVMLGIFCLEIWSSSVQKMLDNWHDHTLTEFQWLYFSLSTLPVLYVSINSVLNPFLFALRHPKIKQKLSIILAHCVTVLSGCFEHFHCHSNAVQQESGVETQETRF